ncbi:PqiC family protein [Cellvibrio sp. UBA7661]|uniref:PqiC family protein n=1 Tax=Cellvibrio sp. UBA7661 TaxID=1946311 RepID=UPI002F357CD7
MSNLKMENNHRMKNVIIIFLLFLFASGCQQSPRKHYYLLSATPTQNQNDAITQTIGLGPIELADYLDRSYIVRNRDTNRLQLADNDHWGEPLEKGIARVLAINLMNRDSTRLVEHFPWRSDVTPALSVRLNIYDLQLINGAATINASWKLIDNSTKTVLSQQRFVRSKSSGESASQITKAYSELLAELAEEMNQALITINGSK